MRFLSCRNTLCLSLLAAPLALPAGRSEAQSTCTTRTECVDANLPYTNRPPRVMVHAVEDTVTTARQSFRFTFTDDFALDASSASYAVSGGGTISATPLWNWNKQFTSAVAQGEVLLARGANIVSAHVCDQLGACSFGVDTIFYRAPPPASEARARPVINTGVNRVDSRDLSLCDGCSEAVITYSTPAYINVDQARQVTLFYSSHQASPRGFVDVEVLDWGTEPAAYMTLQVRGSNGAYVTLASGTSVQHHQTGTGANRLAASWDAASLPTGMYDYTVVVTSYWPNGESRSAEAAVKVPILNERNSPFGAGWTIAGLERAYLAPGGTMITDGMGGVKWFKTTTCSAGNVCEHESPPGDASRLVYMGGYWDRYYEDGGFQEYWGTGYPIFRQNRYGWRTTYNYDGSVRKLLGISDPLNQSIAFGYDPAGRVGSITDPHGRSTLLVYTGSDLSDIYTPDSLRVLQVTYDAAHRVMAWTDARGGRTDVTYDPASGRVSRVEGPVLSDGVTSARATTLVRPREAALLPLPGTGTAAARARRVTPDSVQLVRTDAAGRVTRISTGPFWTATRVADATDAVEISRNGRGQTRTVADGKGNAIAFLYSDSFPFRVTGYTEQNPDGHVNIEVEYGLYGEVTRRRVIGGTDMEYLLDDMGRTHTVMRDGTVVGTATYDGPRVLTETDAGGHTSTYTYHGAGHRNLATVTVAGQTTQYRYDALGRRVQTLRPGVPGDSLAFDGLNRLRYHRAPNGGVTRVDYAGNGLDIALITDPLDQQYRRVHNTLGMVTHAIDAANDTVSYTYHPASGLLKSRSNRRGQTVSYTYDAQGRPAMRTADGATVTWTYDPGHRWTAVTSPASTDTLFFDSEGKVVRSVTVRDGRVFSIRRTYTSRSELDSVIVTGPWGTRNYGYTHDAAGRIDGLRDYTGAWTRLKLTPEGLPYDVQLPTNPGMGASIAYNERHQTSEVRWPGTLGALTHLYRYDARGNMANDSLPAGRGVENWYGHDPADDRLLFWELHVGTPRANCLPTGCTITTIDSLAQAETYAWDVLGNPDNVPVSPGNRLRGYGGYSMEYDADGNLIRKYAPGSEQTFSWNALGQLVAVGRSGSGMVSYAYDGLGRRARRVDGATGALTHYVYGGDDLALEVDGAGNLIREYTYYPGIDKPHSMRQWAAGAGGSVYYYVMQEPGHVNGLLDAAGQLVNQYRYTPFGKPVNGYPKEATANPLQYMARELDAATGMYYVRNRWYDPQVGRFISEDPVGLAAGLNQYTYVGSRPMRGRDPLGLKTCYFLYTTYWVTETVNGKTTYREWTTRELLWCEEPIGGSEGGRGGPRRPDLECEGVDDYACEAILRGIDFLFQHPNDVCRQTGQSAQQRLLLGHYRAEQLFLDANGDPILNADGSPYIPNGHTTLGRPEVTLLAPGLVYPETAATIAEEEWHNVNSWAGHRDDSTFEGPADALAPDQVGDMCKSMPIRHGSTRYDPLHYTIGTGPAPW